MTNLLYQLFKFTVSILAPYFLTFVEPNAAWSTKMLLSLSIFVGWTSLDVLHHVRLADGDRKRATELWLLENKLDAVLSNIRKYYRDVVGDSHGDADLFKDYFDGRFTEMEGMLQAAAERKELLVTDFHFQRTELLLDTFRGDESRLLRYVWILRRTEPVFDQKWEHYCEQILKAATEGAIKGVRALLVLGEGVADDNKVIQTLAGYYEFANRHDYRLVDESSYNHLKADSRLESEYVDFGIYGTNYIYLTMSYGQVTAGKFCKDKVVIGRYTRFFDSIWSSHVCRKVPKTQISRVKLHDLFRATW